MSKPNQPQFAQAPDGSWHPIPGAPPPKKKDVSIGQVIALVAILGFPGGWVQDPSGQWHQVYAAPPKQSNPWTAVGWIVLVLLLVPCVLGGLVVGIAALGAASTSTTTTTRPAVTTTR